MKRQLLICAAFAAAAGSLCAQPVPNRMQPRAAAAGIVKDAGRGISNRLELRRANDADYRLNESFEKDDMNDFTLPDGWEKVTDDDMTWIPYFMGRMGMASFDGLYAAMAQCWSEHDQAWLISPEIEVQAGDQLSYALYFDVRSLYVWRAPAIDEEDGIIVDRINAENMQVCIRVDGGEWVILNDLWQTYGSMGYHEIVDDYSTPEFRQFKIDLSDYVGKKVQIGWCHSYTDSRGGHGMFLDAVKVGAPDLEAGYDLPLSTTFLGLTPGMSYLPGYAFMPCYTDLTYMANVWGAGLKYDWTVTDLEDNVTDTGSGDEFTTRYEPVYVEDGNTNFTMYRFPTLEVSREGANSGFYTYGDEFGYIMAGGRPAMATRDGGEMMFGLTSFDPADGVYTVNADFDIPAWGRNAMTQQWWTRHYLGDVEPTEADVVKITTNMNCFLSSGAPMTVNGVTVFGLGDFDDDVEFKMELVRLSDEFEPVEVMATATMKGSQVTKDTETDFSKPVCAFEFKFDEPVVVDYNMITRFSGFDNDGVRYYAPFQSVLPTNMCNGFVTQSIYVPSIGGERVYENMLPIYVIDGGYGDAMNSFVMVLDAEYPYLHGTDHEFSATAAGQSKTFTLDSWYDAADLKVTSDLAGGALPSWLKVEKAGRFGKTTLTLTADSAPAGANECVLTVEGPGVSYTINVTQSATISGVSEISGDTPAVTAIYDITGKRLATIPAKGVYMVEKRTADGHTVVEKVIR